MLPKIVYDANAKQQKIIFKHKRYALTHRFTTS